MAAAVLQPLCYQRLLKLMESHWLEGQCRSAATASCTTRAVCLTTLANCWLSIGGRAEAGWVNALLCNGSMLYDGSTRSSNFSCMCFYQCNS
jgi:hypothetical protein